MIDSNLNLVQSELTELLTEKEKHTTLLLAGWTGVLYCSKNKLGIVVLRGYLIAGTTTHGTILSNIPAAFRPDGYSVPVPVFRAQSPRNGFVGLFLSSSTGDLTATEQLSENLSAGQAIYINVMYQA